MMNKSATPNLRKDSQLLGKTLLQLALPRLLARVAIFITVVICWYWLISLIYSKGLSLNYKSFKVLEDLGPHASEILNNVNKYIWIVVNVIISLIFLNGLRSWLSQSLAKGRAAPVPLGLFRSLCNALSPEVLEVLRWVWKDPHTPVTVGILQTTLTQVRGGRVAKMALAKAQKEELELAIQPEPESGVIHKDSSGFREPTLLA